mmetsp:Transcript_2968/g.5667  ORF Transcript_2968/g.5667 Transcript_2968/m.5667 type:complete len:81 (-) Transcript_2968:12-254(-)
MDDRFRDLSNSPQEIVALFRYNGTKNHASISNHKDFTFMRYIFSKFSEKELALVSKNSNVAQVFIHREETKRLLSGFMFD